MLRECANCDYSKLLNSYVVYCNFHEESCRIEEQCEQFIPNGQILLESINNSLDELADDLTKNNLNKLIGELNKL